VERRWKRGGFGEEVEKGGVKEVAKRGGLRRW
jgi:hypothetical protein